MAETSAWRAQKIESIAFVGEMIEKFKDSARTEGGELSGFEREYFIQTRNEIDTEKRERDRLLHFAILLLGGISAVVIQKYDVTEVIGSTDSLYIEMPLLIIITSMFWIRWKKLSQIADRWWVLFHILEDSLGKQQTKHFLESTVIDGFSRRRYIRKDLALNFCLCFPIYAIMIMSSVKWIRGGPVRYGLASLAFVILHVAMSVYLLWRPMVDPQKRKQKGL